MAKKKKNIPPKFKQDFNIPQESTSKPVINSSIKSKQADVKTMDFAFGKSNYIYMIAGLILIAIGFILMIGGGSDNPNEFNEAIFDTRRLTIAPILILLGYAVEIYAILKKPAKE